VTGHRTVRIATFGLLALGLSLAVSASSRAADPGNDLYISLTGPSSNPVAGGAAFTISADVSNSSGTDVTSFTADITLPGGISFVSSGDGCAPDGGNAQLIHCPRGAITSGGTDDTFAFTASAAPSAAGNTTITPSLVNIVPNTVAASADNLPLTVDGQADLQPSITGPSGDQTAGKSTGFDYTVKVHNAGPSDNVGGYTLTGTLPSGVVFDPSGDCSGSGGSFTCSNSTGLAFGATDDSYTVHVKVLASACPGGTLATPPCDGNVTATASVATASAGTPDPNPPGAPPAGDDASATTSIITEADLQPSITAPAGPLVAGDPAGFDYTVKVHNAGPSDNVGGYTLTGTLPSGVVFDPSGDCSGSGGSFTCSNSTGLAAGAPDDSYTVHAKVLASACPGGTVIVPSCNGNVTATASVATDGTTDPNPAGAPPAGDDASATTSIVTKADLEAQSMSSTASSLFANTAPANATTFTYQFTNHGLSDAQHVVISLPDHPLASANPTYFKIDDLCRVTGTVTCANQGDFGTGTDIGEVDAGATVTVIIHAHANARLGHNSPDPIATGSFVVTSTATVATSTTDPGAFPNVRNNLSPNVTISTVPSPPRNPFGIPGTGNTILTWENPAGNGGQPVQNFLITVTPPVGSSFTLPTVPFNASPTSKCGAVNASDCYQLTVTGLQNDHGAYTFGIQAQNAVGPSDSATTTATPSVNAKNASVPTNTATTLTTCTTATPTTPVCVVYSIPSGAGGVFGAGGLVALPTGLCGINVSCINNTGAQNLGSLAGYNDRTHPLIETITWDSSLINSSFYTNVPSCPNNSTATNCYPNNIPIYYEDTFTLLHCGVGFPGTCDPNTLVDHSLFPVVPGTVLNTHFCALAINNGGAGNKNYARPKPSPLGIYNGYNDPSGSACIKSMNALGSSNSPGANRDIQVVINMTSDSDGLAGRH